MKHKYIIILLLIIVMLALFPVTTLATESASGTCGALTWELDENGCLYISGEGPMPEFIDSTPWAHLAPFIETIEIGQGVTTISASAFFGFESLVTVILPDSLNQIGSAAFFSCKELTWILNSELEQAIPDGVQIIDDAAFCGCDNLTNLTLGNSVLRIGNSAFSGCTELVQIILSHVLQYIDNYAFYGCYALESVAFPGSVSYVGEQAFGNCYRISDIHFAGNAPQIHETAFASNFEPVKAIAFYPEGNLTWTADKRVGYGGQLTWRVTPDDCLAIGICGDNVTWELKRSGLMTISGTGPMYNYNTIHYPPWYGIKDAITQLVVDNGITAIGETSFYKCYNLAHISLPSTVTAIEKYAFFDCNSLSSVEISASVTTLYFESFMACDSLKTITVDEANPCFSSDDQGCLLNKQMTRLILVPCAFEGHYTIPNSVTEIGQSALDGCEFLTSVTIPSSVTSIGDGAFSLCFGLQSIVIPENVNYIGRCAFWCCVSLEEIKFCGDAPVMGEEMFVRVNATAFYPRGNRTWTEATMLNYDGTLNWVAYNKTKNIVDEWNISLADNLVVNFYLDEEISPNDTLTVTVASDETSYYVSNLKTDTQGRYILRVNVAAAQMNEIISLSADGFVSAEYTIRQYCDSILADESYRQYHTLVKDMLNYGAMAQIYFSYNIDNLANVGITGASDVAVPEKMEEHIVSGKLNELTFYGASLVYRDRIAVRYYFTGDATGCTFIANGNAYTPVTKDGMYYIEISDILPQYLDQKITMIVTDANGNTLSVTYGPMNYIVRMNEKGNETLKHLVNALYNYHLSAQGLHTYN